MVSPRGERMKNWLNIFQSLRQARMLTQHSYILQPASFLVPNCVWERDRQGRPRLTFANQLRYVLNTVRWSDNMDYVMHVKYSSFHSHIIQFFQVFTIAPRLYHLEYWLAGRHRHLSSLLKAEPFKIPKTSATTGQKVGTRHQYQPHPPV